ncbi:MAG TPA: hypothetical protein VGR02_09725 [Thermoanaerobaculia bacterium]|nr:hypothetical protein [Thermoanaerobaculia bacterium]
MAQDRKQRLDIFICGGSQHVGLLEPLLPKLQAGGTVHLGSCFLSDDDLARLDGRYDVLHTPRHSPDPYCNFELFSIRDINRLATAPWFVKLDADIELEPDWIGYVEECIARHPEAVLFGPRKGNRDVTLELSGALVRQLFGRELRVQNAPKVIGGFYVGRTEFFRQHARLFDFTHELLWCFEDGVRRRPSINPDFWPPEGELHVTGDTTHFRTRGNEDTLRNFVVHAAGAGDRLHVFDSGGRVRIERPNTVMG